MGGWVLEWVGGWNHCAQCPYPHLKTHTHTKQVEAHKYDLNYIGLSGNIGCMVNGAGCVVCFSSQAAASVL